MKLLFVFFVTLTMGLWLGEGRNEVTSKPIIQFEKEVLKPDTVVEGQIVTLKYFFYNKGDAPLQLYNVKSSCGCLTVSWPKGKIASGKYDYIVGKLSTKGRPGMCQKSITVITNEPEDNVHILRVKTFIRRKTPKEMNTTYSR